MSSLPEIKAQLGGAGSPFTFVRGATSMAQVKGDRPEAVLPVAYVLSAKEVTADNPRATGSVLQKQERDIMIVIVVEDLGDADGDTVQDPLEDLKAYVRGKLLGFKPTDMVDRITHVGGEVVEAASGCVWFADTFSAPIYLKENI